MTKQNIEGQLETLRSKWRGKVPRGSADHQWWAYKVDCLKGTRLHFLLDHLPEVNLQTAAEMIFNP